VVWDPDKPLTVSAATHRSNVDNNRYEGTKVVGAPDAWLLRGHLWGHPDRGPRRR
jgi:dihydroorotase-like cyclic amidohydrolase